MTQLNFDVLCVICSFLTDVSDVLSFSLTCSSLRPVAVRRRLSMRPITLAGPKSVRELYNFVFVDEQARGPQICAITIPVQRALRDPSKQLVDCLLAVLASATSLRTLSLYVPGRQSTLFSHPRFLAAVAEMSSLQELSIVSSVDLANHLLGSTRSSLKTFRHSDLYKEYERKLLTSGTAPQLASTLEEIDVPLSFLVAAAKSSTSLPAVRSVTLTGVFDLFRLEILLAVFPNLDRTLIVNESIGAYGDDDLVALQRLNREAQKTRGWKGIDRVATSPFMLHALGLTCPIRHLTVNNRLNTDKLVQASGIPRAVFQDCAPTHLVLGHLRLPEGLSVFDDSPLLHTDAVSRLTHLVLDAVYTNMAFPTGPGLRPERGSVAGEPSWDTVLDTLLSALKALPRLTHVRIVICCSVRFVYPFSVSVYDGVRSFKFDRLVATLPSVIPSLTHIFITSLGLSYLGPGKGEDKWETSRAWRVRRPCVGTRARAPGETVGIEALHELEELSTEHGEGAMDREDMRATETTKWIMEQDEDDDEEPLA